MADDENKSGDTSSQNVTIDPVPVESWLEMAHRSANDMKNKLEKTDGDEKDHIGKLLDNASYAGDVQKVLFAVQRAHEGYQGALAQSQDRFSKLEESQTALTEERSKTSALSGELGALRRQYKELKMLGDAASFWSAKAARHSRAWSLSLGAFIAIVLAALGCLISYWPTISEMLPRTTSGDLTISGVGVLFLLALGPVWMLRLLSRFFYQNLMWGDDAKARETMIFTYLALVGNPDADMKPDERSFMLHNVFRSNYADHDDPMPSSALEIVAKLLDRSNKS